MPINPWVAGAAGAGAGALANNFMGRGYKNPANAAMPYLNGIPDQLNKNFQPYVNAGQGALDKLPGVYDKMLHPNDLLNEIGGGYHESPGYQWQLGQGENAISNAASAGGMLGTPQHQQQNAQMAEGLANQDYYNYLGKALGEYNQGATGEAGLSGQGYDASKELGEDLSQNSMNEANLAYTGAANQNQYKGQNTGGIMALLGHLLGGGAGALFGGPMGAAAGSSIGGSLGDEFDNNFQFEDR